MTKIFGVRRRGTRRRSERGQSMIEFALTFPVFLGVFLGLAGFALLFYSYVTVQLAVREGTSALVHDPHQTVTQIQNQVRATSISLDPNALTITVEPSNTAQWVQGTKVNVTAVYMVPLPTVFLPNLRGNSFQLLGPVPLTAVSVMTIE